MLSVTHNMSAMNSQRQLNVNSKTRAKATEKLASGYKINRAADDAAGLSISEKMRQLIRGLEQGTENAQDGVSWTQIGDGALVEAHSILQRMNELSVQALNGTNSREDREAIQAEFDQLQTELDRISATTEFNELGIFEEHLSTYYQCEGAIQWEMDQPHSIYVPKNELTIKYRQHDAATPEEITITIPEGRYTTQELADEIDTALEDAGGLADGIMFELTDDGYCNVNYEGGKVIDSVSGALSYLLYDMYEGGEFGALIGTTDFSGGYPLKITEENNNISFVIQNLDGTEIPKNIELAPGRYTREQLIDIFNNTYLTDTSVKASAYGNGIKLGSDDAIVTKFKGDMFKLDFGNNVHTSVFYDNVAYGNVSKEPGVFTGGAVLNSNSKDVEYNKFHITDSNNQLLIKTDKVKDPVSITIPKDRDYTISEMENMLNSLFDDAGLGVNVDSYSQYISGQYFYGLKITTDSKGLGSNIEIDPNSSAYQTLFTQSNYTIYGYAADVSNETSSDRCASFTGSKALHNLSTDSLEITDAAPNANHIFVLNIDNGKEKLDVEIPTGIYDSADKLLAEINAQISGKGITAKLSGNVIQFVTDINAKIGSVKAEAKSGNGGFDAVIQGYNVTYSTDKKQGSGSLVLGDINKLDPNKNLTVTVGGNQVNVDPGLLGNMTVGTTVTLKEPVTTETPITFSAISARGETNNRNYDVTSQSGRTNIPNYAGKTVTGSHFTPEGAVAPTENNPAKYVLSDIKIPSSVTVRDTTNSFKVTVNNVPKTVYLTANKTYSQSELVKELQKQLDAAYGTDLGSVAVSISNNNLVLTARLGATGEGGNTSIYLDPNDSSLLNELATTRTAAKLTTNLALANSFTLDNNSNTFTFSMKENNVSHTYTLNLPSKDYTPTSFVQALNSELSAKGIGATATLSKDNKLELTSKAVGDGNSISYGTSGGAGGTSSEKIFGPMMTYKPAKKVVNTATQDKISIAENDTFRITVDGNPVDITFDAADAKEYTRQGFVDMLNQKLAGQGVRAYVDGRYIGYETTSTGNQATFAMNYNNGGTSMKKIYGINSHTTPGLYADVTADGMLKLTTGSGTSLAVSSDAGGGFVEQKVITTALNNTSQTGYYSTKQGTINGQNLSLPINIDEYADDLSFTYTDSSTGTTISKTISIKVPQQSYASYAELENVLEGLLDAETTKNGMGNLSVTVDSSGVVIKTPGTGLTNTLKNPYGDFYDKILCSSNEKSDARNVSNKTGTQRADSAFIVGRKDIVTNPIRIRSNVSDELSLDFTDGSGVPKTLNMKLDAGEYDSEGIQNEIQKKLNEALTNAGLPKDMIQVGVGNIYTGVVGANDGRALNFKLNPDVAVPNEGTCIIDAIGGNAAFEVFYSTDGELIPAYVTGTKEISEGVTIEDGKNTITFAVDAGTPNEVIVDITLEPKEYTKDEIMETLNQKLQDAGAPVLAEEDDGHIKISYVSLGKHSIAVEGPAKTALFFQENGEEGPAIGINIQLSSDVGDCIEIPRTEVSTCLLGINTVCVTEEKYASKALERVGAAIDLISALRSTFGSVQNRLEHAIANNENKHENTTAAESRIRDTDMSESMVELAKHNILQQAGEAVLAQANASQNNIVNLLQS